MVNISIWSDIACPWCFVGKANLDAAVQQLAVDDPKVALQIRWRAFELDPRPREPSTQNYVERLAAKYQRSVADAQEMIDTMTQAISDAGGFADFGKVIAANTFNAHRLIQWAGDTDQHRRTNSAQHRLKGAFMRGYLGHGVNLGKEDDLLGVVESVELDRAAAGDVLSSDKFADTVRADEATAEQHGIRGVPFFVIGDYGLSGAQPSARLIEAIRSSVAADPDSG